MGAVEVHLQALFNVIITRSTAYSSYCLVEPSGYEAGWSQELVTMSWSREISASARKWSL